MFVLHRIEGLRSLFFIFAHVFEHGFYVAEYLFPAESCL
jgi:succinate dehydrogenase/fumarate reductase cytochrome b subunit